MRTLAALIAIGALATGGAAHARLVAVADVEGAGVGQVTLAGSATLVGGVLSFPTNNANNGTDFGFINGFPGFSDNHDWSISMWLNYEKYNSTFDYDILNLNLTSGSKGLLRTDEGLSGSGLTYVRIDAEGGDMFVPSNTPVDLAPDAWHHLGVVHNQTLAQTEYFIDGVSIGSVANSTWRLEPGSIRLGGSPGGKRDLRGQIKGVGFYDEALSIGDFSVLAEGERPTGSETPSPNLAYLAPTGGWTYAFTGDRDDFALDGNSNPRGFSALDGRWDHESANDTWDGSAPGAGAPGGVASYSEDGVAYLRMQDAGDPTDYGMPDDSNRKIILGHDMTAAGASNAILDEGVTMSFRMRIPTPGGTANPLDDQRPNGGGGVEPWPAEGHGYLVHDAGKGTGIRAANDKFVSFALTNGEDGYSQAGLAMNALIGDSPSGLVDAGEGSENVLPLDPTEWHEFWITIEDNGGDAGTHRVTVYYDGDTVGSVFNVTAGNGNESGVYAAISYLTMDLSSTGGFGAYDIDFIAWAPGVQLPTAVIPEPSSLGLALLAFAALGVGRRKRMTK